MIIYLAQHLDYDGSLLLRSFDTEDRARDWIKKAINREMDYVQLLRHDTAEPDEFVTVDTFQYRPHKWTGPLARARLVSMADPPGYAHRVPIDCARPEPRAQINEFHDYRIVDSEHCGTSGVHGTQPWECHCVGWKIVEGTPEAVDKLIAMYGGEKI